MTKGLQRSQDRGPKASANIVKDVIRLVDVSITVESTGVGTGAVVISDFPEGNVLLLGATCTMTFDAIDQAGVTATWTGDFGVGTAPIAGDTIDGTEGNIVPSTALAAATGSVSSRTRGVNATNAMLDNTDGSLEVNLNLVVDDVSISADSTILASGDFFVSYVMMGD